MASPIERWVSGGGNLYFGRMADGAIVVALMADERPPDHPSGCAFFYQAKVDENHWGSIVLTMTAFDERPNDWHAFMAHHLGKHDLMEAPKTLDTVRNVVRPH